MKIFFRYVEIIPKNACFLFKEKVLLITSTFARCARTNKEILRWFQYFRLHFWINLGTFPLLAAKVKRRRISSEGTLHLLVIHETQRLHTVDEWKYSSLTHAHQWQWKNFSLIAPSTLFSIGKENTIKRRMYCEAHTRTSTSFIEAMLSRWVREKFSVKISCVRRRQRRRWYSSREFFFSVPVAITFLVFYFLVYFSTEIRSKEIQTTE